MLKRHQDGDYDLLALGLINIDAVFIVKGKHLLADNGDEEAFREYNGMECMECGCCSYVCPAHRPLVQTNKLGKQMLKKYLSAKQAQKENDLKERSVRERQEKEAKK